MKKVAGVLTLLTVAVLYVDALGAESLKDRLPAEAYGYVAVTDVPGFLAKVRASYVYTQLMEHGVLGNLDVIPGFGDVRDAWSKYVEPLGGILKGEMVAAVLPAPEGEIEPRVVFLVRVDEAALTAYLEANVYPVIKAEVGEIEQIDRSGLTILRLPVDPDPDADVLYLCVKHGLAVVGEQIEDVEGLVRGTLDGRLTKGAAYAAVRTAIGEADVEFVLDVPAILRDAAAGNGEAWAVIARMGFDHVRAVGWGIRLDEQGSLSTLRVATDAPPGTIAALLGRATGDPKSLRYVPDDAVFYASLRFGSLVELYQAALKLVQQASGKNTVSAILGLDEFEATLELDLHEVLGAFGGELAVAVWFNRGAPMPSGAVAVEVRDQAAVEVLIKKAVELLTEAEGDRAEVSTAQYKGTTIRTVELSSMLSPSCAVVGEFLVVGASRGAVETVINTLGNGRGLDTSQVYTKAMARVGGGGLTFYMDYSAFGRFWLSRVPWAAGDSEELAGLFAETLPLASALRVDAGGVTYCSASHVEFVDGSFPLMAGMLLPALARARAQAREATSMNNARQISMAIMRFADANDDVLPERLSQLVEGEYILSSKVFVHPAGTDPDLIDPGRPETVDEHSDYELVLKGVSLDEVEDPAHTVLLRERREFVRGRRVVVYVDGHARTVLSDKEDQ
ncbi:MAG: hypothetical protein JW889_01110 [Verrucomicrobia bacterium]|nr:hypothetical protein [Verrucomicrobiota bacterium]